MTGLLFHLHLVLKLLSEDVFADLLVFAVQRAINYVRIDLKNEHFRYMLLRA